MKAIVLGVGRMGRRHIQVAAKAGCELAGVYDVRKESLDEAKREYGLDDALLFDDIDRLYKVARPDCVIIATTADSHETLTCMAAQRGAKFVLVEKPMATSLDACDRMIATCARHGVGLAVNHQMRFMEQYTRPKALFGSDAFGEMGSMSVVAGNFGLSMNGCHYFEAFRYLADDELVDVSAWFSPDTVPNPRGAQFGDRGGSVRITTRSGKRFYMEAGTDQGHGVRVVYGARQGMITINELSGELAGTERQEEFRSLPTTRYGMPAVERRETIAPAEVIDTSAEVLRALIAGQNSVTGEHGRSAVEVLVAAHQSAEAGGARVMLGAGLDRTRIFPWA